MNLPLMTMAPRMMLLGLAVLACLAAPTRGGESYREPFRPQFHFTPAKNWMNDPNGMLFYEGEYHLFYQYNPFGDKWGHMSWGHAVSRDLLHWEHLPVALLEENGIMIFSGSAVVDWKNTSGFGKDGKPPLVAIYTGHYTAKPLQNQQIAYSNDRGRTWTKYSGNPVLDIGERDFRDPKVLWQEESKRWIMTVAWPLQHKVRFYSSPNLREWTHLSDFGPAGATNGIWECPDLFPLAVEGGKEKRWVLIVNLNPGGPAGGSGCQYFVGDFDGTRFTPDPSSGSAPLWADYAPDFYAGVSWSDIPKRDGRRLWLGWMSNWLYAGDVPTAPWRSAMSLPRELGLRQTRDGLRLVQTPVRELKSLRQERHRLRNATFAKANEWLSAKNVSGAAWEIDAEFGLGQSGADAPFGIKLLQGPAQETVIRCEPGNKSLTMDRTRSGRGDFHKEFPSKFAAPLTIDGQTVRLRLIVDTSSVEIFANDGASVMTALAFPALSDQPIELWSAGDSVKIRRLDVWKLKPATPFEEQAAGK